MKKIILVFVLVFLFIPFTNIQAQTKITLKGGLSLANMLAEDNTEEINLDNITGYHFGGIFEFPITELFSVETGISASKKGFIQDLSDQYYYYGDAENEWNLFYVDIPLNLKVNVEAGNIDVFGMAGPTLGIGISGTRKLTESYGSYSYSEEYDIDWGSDEEEDDLKRFDYGLLLGAGISMGSFLASVSYELGLANISAYTQDDATLKNRVLKFSVGYIIIGNQPN